MELHFLPEALAFSWAQVFVGFVGALVLFLLARSLAKTVLKTGKDLENKKELTFEDWSWAATKVVAMGLTFFFVLFAMQNAVVYGPKNSLRSPITATEREAGEIINLSKPEKTDEERLQQNRSLNTENLELVPPNK